MSVYEVTTADGATYEIETTENPVPRSGKNNTVRDAIASGIGNVSGMINPLLPLAISPAARAVARNPRETALAASDYLPAAGAIAAPLAVTLPTGGMAIPAAAAASGLGAAGGEGLRQMVRRGIGVEPAPPIPNPVPFTKGDLPRIPIVSPEVSNLVTQGGVGVAQDLAVQPLRLLPKVGRGIINAISPSNIKAADILERYKNPKGVKTALPRENLGKVLVEQHKNLSQQISALDTAARETLNTSPTIPKSKVIEMLKNIKGKTVGTAGKAASSEAKASVGVVDNAIDAIKQMNPLPNIKPGTIKVPFETSAGTGGLGKTIGGEIGIPGRAGAFGDKISEAQLKDLMSQYKNIPWDDPSANAQKQVRNFLDYILKKQNKTYANAMKPVAERAKVQSVIEKKMGLKYDPTSGTYATDATAGKWTPRLLEGGRPESSSALKKLDKLTNGNIMEKARLTNIRENFEGGKTTGSRMVQLGRHIGGPVGGIAGALMDKAGGKITGGMVDALKFASETIGSPLNTQTASALLKAISRKKSVSDTK